MEILIFVTLGAIVLNRLKRPYKVIEVMGRAYKVPKNTTRITIKGYWT